LGQHFFIGIDGGGTRSTVRMEDETGQLLGRVVGGPANICLSVDESWQSIHSSLNSILQPLALSLSNPEQTFHVGMGLAGSESTIARQAFLQKVQQQRVTSLIVASDAHIACLGAHGGEDGAVIIIGTGVVGYAIQANKQEKVSGWGFPHDDQGSGAWLGLEAVKITLQWLDGRSLVSGLAQAVFAYFANNQVDFVTWANHANATAFAKIGPIVVRQAQIGDSVAIMLMQQAAEAVDRVERALVATRCSSLPCALVGGMAFFVETYLSASLRKRLRPCQATPDVGAMLMIRGYVKDKLHAATDLFWATNFD
jgi:glucosamine kinase